MDALTAVQRLGGGKLIERIADAVAEVSNEVLMTGKKGAVSVTFTVDKADFSDITVTVGTEITRKFPTTKAGGSFFFVHEGGLYADDPRQQRLDFQIVETGTDEVRTVDEQLGEIREAGNA